MEEFKLRYTYSNVDFRNTSELPTEVITRIKKKLSLIAVFDGKVLISRIFNMAISFNSLNTFH